MGGIVDVDAARVDKVGSKFGASCLSGSRKLARFAASAPPSSQSVIRSTLLYIGTLLAWSPARFPHSASALRLSTLSTLLTAVPDTTDAEAETDHRTTAVVYTHTSHPLYPPLCLTHPSLPLTVILVVVVVVSPWLLYWDSALNVESASRTFFFLFPFDRLPLSSSLSSLSSSSSHNGASTSVYGSSNSRICRQG